MFGFLRKPAPEPELPEELRDYEELAQILRGRYHLRSRLESDSGWQALAGLDAGNGQPVRISVWPKWVACESDWEQRCRRELAVCQTLRHPNLVPVLDFSQEGEWLWWVSPEWPGQPLEEWMKRSRPAPGLVRTWLEQLLLALEFLHQRGIVHRNLAPAWLLVEGERLWLTETTFRQLGRQVVVGSADLACPRFMAPEEILGSGTGPAANYFSLGAILYEMLTGERAFPGEDVIKVLMQLVLVELPDMSRLPEPYRDMLPRLLERDPEQRLCRAPEILNFKPVMRAAGEATAGLVAELQAQARLVSQNDRFTLSPERALEKLRDFRFPERWDWLLALCAAAGGLGARALELHWQKQRLSLSYTGVVLDSAQLEGLWMNAYGIKQPGLSWLALGLASVLHQFRGRLELASGGRSLSASEVGPVRLGRSLASHLRVVLSGVPEPDDWLTVRSRFQYAPFAINWNGQRQERVAPNQPDLPGGFKLRLDLLLPDQALAVVDGLSFPLPLKNPLPGRVLVWGRLELDAERRNLVVGGLEQLEVQLAEAVRAEVEGFCSGPISLETRALAIYRRYLNSLDPTDPARGRLLQAYLEGVDEQRGLSAFFWEECWAHWVRQNERPQRFYELARGRPFVQRCRFGWTELVTVGKRAFAGRPLEAARWLLEAWLDWELSLSPGSWEVLELWQRLTYLELPDSYDQALARKLKAGLVKGWSPEQLRAWLELLPRNWLRSRGLLQPYLSEKD